jgi:hypothetical protein
MPGGDEASTTVTVLALPGLAVYEGALASFLAGGVTLAGEMPGLAPGDAVALAYDDPGGRQGVQAHFAGTRGGMAVFSLMGEFARLPHVDVRSVLGQSRHRGSVLHLDAEGVVVELPGKPGGNTLEVSMEVGGFAAHLVCRVAQSQGVAGRHWLALRFEDLTPAQRAFLRTAMGAGLKKDE